MAGSERAFVQAIRRYCVERHIPVDVRADGWLVVMDSGPARRFAFGYDIGLNSAIAHRLANDKSATAEILALCGVPHIPHRLFLNPTLGEHVVERNWMDSMLSLLDHNPHGLVIKPNEGTSGRSVVKATTRGELERAVGNVFSSSLGLVIAPYVEIEQEVRVILLGEKVMAVYGKERPWVAGDGVRTLRELAREEPKDWLRETDETALDAVVPAGEKRLLSWRHNLDGGAKPVLIDNGPSRAICAELALRAAAAIGIDFASVDIVRVDGSWRVLEINSGVMMEVLGKLHPDLVQGIYDAALDRLFARTPSSSPQSDGDGRPKRG